MHGGGEALAPVLPEQVVVRGRQERVGRERAEQPAEAPESSSEREPACSPLPETSTTATWRRPAVPDREATRKSPANDEPPAERSTASAYQPSGSAGIRA